MPPLLRHLDLAFDPQPANIADTPSFSAVSHDDMCRAVVAYLRLVEPVIGGFVQGTLTQGLRDSGVDVIGKLDSISFAVQVKSYGDLQQADAFSKLKAQITESRKYEISRLYILLCGDETNPSQRERMRGIIADIAQISDQRLRVIDASRALSIYRLSTDETAASQISPRIQRVISNTIKEYAEQLSSSLSSELSGSVELALKQIPIKVLQAVDNSRVFRLSEIIQTETRLWITGPSGSGKTTSLKKVALHLATALLDGQPNHKSIPVYVDLRAYGPRDLDTLISYAIGSTLQDQLLVEYQQATSLVLLIDFFDDLSTQEQDRVIREASSLASRLQQCFICVASQAARKAKAIEAAAYRIESPNTETIKALVTNLITDPLTRERYLEDALTSNSTNVLTTPQAIEFSCKAYLHHERIYRNPAQLTRHYTELLLEQTSFDTEIPTWTRIKLLGHLAQDIATSEGRFTEADALRSIARTWKEIKAEFGFEATDLGSSQFLENFSRSGVLENIQGNVSFRHEWIRDFTRASIIEKSSSPLPFTASTERGARCMYVADTDLPTRDMLLRHLLVDDSVAFVRLLDLPRADIRPTELGNQSDDLRDYFGAVLSIFHEIAPKHFPQIAPAFASLTDVQVNIQQGATYGMVSFMEAIATQSGGAPQRSFFRSKFEVKEIYARSPAQFAFYRLFDASIRSFQNIQPSRELSRAALLDSIRPCMHLPERSVTWNRRLVKQIITQYFDAYLAAYTNYSQMAFPTIAPEFSYSYSDFSIVAEVEFDADPEPRVRYAALSPEYVNGSVLVVDTSEVAKPFFFDCQNNRAIIANGSFPLEAPVEIHEEDLFSLGNWAPGIAARNEISVQVEQLFGNWVDLSARYWSTIRSVYSERKLALHVVIGPPHPAGPPPRPNIRS